MQFQRYKETLLRILGEDVVDLLQKSRAIIAGGAITSMFTASKINDFDIYFRSKEDLLFFVRMAFKKTGTGDDYGYNLPEDHPPFFSMSCTNYTKRSLSFANNQNDLQLIHFDYFEDAHAIFESYDFHFNMAAYDFSTSEFVMHDLFLETMAARRSTFNPKTKYPIMSLARVEKYLERGYSITKKEQFKIGIACSSLNLDSYEAVEDQISGFYGIDVSDIFDHSVPFSLENVYEMIEAIRETPYDKRNVPTFDQVMFNLLDNPYKDQTKFFAVLELRTVDGKRKLVDLNNKDNVFDLDIAISPRNGIRVFSTMKELKDRTYLDSFRERCIIECKPNSKMTMETDGLYIYDELMVIGSAKRV